MTGIKATPRRRRRKKHVCLWCGEAFTAKEIGEWFCRDEHRSWARKGRDPETWTLSDDEKESSKAVMKEFEKKYGGARPKSFRFGKGGDGTKKPKKR